MLRLNCVCSSATNRLTTSKDHASVQINRVNIVNKTAKIVKVFLIYHSINCNAYLFLLLLMSFILSKFQGDGDSALDRLWQKKKVEVQQQ